MKEEIDLERLDCPVCGTVTYYQKNLLDMRRNGGGEFYCPNGHKLNFTANTLATIQKKLATVEEELKRVKTENLKLLHDLEQLEGKLTKSE